MLPAIGRYVCECYELYVPPAPESVHLKGKEENRHETQYSGCRDRFRAALKRIRPHRRNCKCHPPRYGREFLELVASIYPGYKPRPKLSQVAVGTAYAVVDGAVGGALFAWLYNRLTSCCEDTELARD